MTVVVTGAAGFVGWNLTQALVNEGRVVRAVIFHEGERQVLAPFASEIEIVQADIRDRAALIPAITGAEVVYHLAAYISLQMHEWDLVKSINVDGVQNVVDVCLDCGVRRLVHFSSFHAHDQQPLDQPLDENRALVEAPEHSPYDRSKAAGERIVRAAIQRGLDAVIVNPTAVTGPNDFCPSLFGTALLDMARGRFPVSIGGGCDWVDVRDVVTGAMQAERHAPSGAKYLLSGHWMAIPDVAAIIASITGGVTPRYAVPMGVARPLAVANETICRKLGIFTRFTTVSLRELSGNRRISHARAAAELGYKPRPLTETLRDALHWHHQQGNVTLAASSLA